MRGSASAWLLVGLLAPASSGVGGLQAVGAREMQISTGPAGSYEVDLVAARRGWALAWYDTRDGNPEIYFTRLDDVGKRLLPEIRITYNATRSYGASLAESGARYGVAWYELPPSRRVHAPGEGVVWLAVLDRQGQVLAARQVSRAGVAARSPKLLADGRGFVLLWIETANPEAPPQVVGRRFDRLGAPAGAKVELTPASDQTWNLNAVSHRGRLHVVFDSAVDSAAHERDAEDSEQELFLLQTRLDLSAAEKRPLTRCDGFASVYPDLALRRGAAWLTWWDRRDGRAEVYHGALDLESARIEERRLTFGPGESLGAYIVGTRRGWAIAYTNDASGSHQIQVARLDRAGQAKVERLTFARHDSLVPAIARRSRALALAWNDYRWADERNRERSVIYFATLPVSPARRSPDSERH